MDINAVQDVPMPLTSIQKKRWIVVKVLVNYKFLISVIIVDFLIFFGSMTTTNLAWKF